MTEAFEHLSALNTSQRAAAEYGTEHLPKKLPGPLLIIAGAGTGKTTTLAHRLAHLVVRGADPGRILLLTFTRRAAEIMTRRAENIVSKLAKHGRTIPPKVQWSGTFHAVGNRLLHMYSKPVGLLPGFTVLDRSDAEDVLNLLRHELGFSKMPKRFPRKGTCLAIYSQAVNAGEPIEKTLARAFPAWTEYEDQLKQLFREYVITKQRRNVLDYDDLLLYWSQLMQSATAASVRRRFDHVLVDEYQDTNALQAGILRGLTPDGSGLTVVGDDAQSIYSFRAATVRNILDFPGQFTPRAHVITLEQNYRSTQPILDAANAVIALAHEGVRKQLISTRRSEQRPLLVAMRDEQAQADYVVERVLEHREAGIDLKEQAVLMRAGYHAALLEIELARRNIPFVKYGGLKFLEAAHVKDVLCVLRWAENPRDLIAAFRVLQLLPGLGPANANRVCAELETEGFDVTKLAALQVPAATRADWPLFCELVQTLRRAKQWQGQLGTVRRWYQPHLERLYETAHLRAADLEQLEQIAASAPSREHFLSDVTLDPPNGIANESGASTPDDDYLILSTIHSAKGQEWDIVYILNAVDGCIPSDMATGTAEEIEEERRLLYVAMTRARDWLYVLQPHRMFMRGRFDDDHTYAARTRFIPDTVLRFFERTTAQNVLESSRADELVIGVSNVRERLQRMWA